MPPDLNWEPGTFATSPRQNPAAWYLQLTNLGEQPTLRAHSATTLPAHAAPAPKMSSQQQAMILDTILALKRTLKRKAYGACS